MNANQIRDWIRQQAPSWGGGSRWLLAPGPNWVPNEEWGKRSFRTLVARLSPWQDVVQSSTHRLLYAILRRNPQIFPDLAFLPPLHEVQNMRQQGIPWWFGLGTQCPVQDFDCLAISNALVQELVNLPPTLVACGIPLCKANRLARRDLPLVILGGANSLHTSLLWTKDPYVDGIFIGEETSQIEALFELCVQSQKDDLSKEQTLQRMADTIPGFFLPEAPKAIKTHTTVPRVNPYKNEEPLIPHADVAGTSSIHLSEGCPYFCSFCAESYARKPYRETPLEQAITEARALKMAQGLDGIDLFSFNFNTYTHIQELVRNLEKLYGKVNLKSQRFDALARDPVLMEMQRHVGKFSLTCGLEGISNRMRAYLQKDLQEDQARIALETILSGSLRELKIFLIACGVEEDQDFAEFRIFLQWFRHLYDRTQRRPRVLFSATPLVRFPWTPLEFEDAPSAEDSGKMVRRIKDCVLRAGFEFRAAASEWEAEVSQILVRVRDARVAEALRLAQERTGFLYAASIEEPFALTLRQSLKEKGLDWKALLCGQDPQDKTPWENVSPGIRRKFLIQRHEACRLALQKPTCLGERCQSCGACTPQERKILTTQRHPSPFLPASPVVAEQILRLRLDLDPHCLGWPWKTLSSWAVHGFLEENPAWVDSFRRHLPGDWETQLDYEYCQVCGENDFALAFSEALKIDPSILEGPQFQAKVNARCNGWMRLLGQGEAQPHPGRLEIVLEQEPLKISDWLLSKGLKHTLQKQGTSYYYGFSREALRKQILASLVWNRNSGTLILEPLAKFSLREFPIQGIIRNFYKKA
ncbi:MAG TPA: radical SAM protein [Fibrobacteraceae bacterium]|nr:radical SAM protein [Fibrobacteraceae bacterium]